MGQETPTSARPLASSCVTVSKWGISLAVKAHAGFALRFCSLTVCCSQLFKDVPSREIEGAVSEKCMFWFQPLSKGRLQGMERSREFPTSIIQI